MVMPLGEEWTIVSPQICMNTANSPVLNTVESGDMAQNITLRNQYGATSDFNYSLKYNRRLDISKSFDVIINVELI